MNNKKEGYEKYNQDYLAKNSGSYSYHIIIKEWIF